MDDFKDKRFRGIIKDPRFKKIPMKHMKTKVGKRFHQMFTGKEFQLRCNVDKRGSPLDHKVTEDCPKFYQLDEDGRVFKAENNSISEDEQRVEDESDDSCSVNGKAEDDSSNVNNDNCGKDIDEESEGDAEEVPKLDASSDEDSSTSTETEASDNEQEEEIDHRWQELDADAPRAGNITHRLAVCNMDWDRLHAEDFLVVFNSFKPRDGIIHSIKIYPSEYGLERMEKEKVHGPAELIDEKLGSIEDKTTNGTKGSHFHREKLRQYQINRLKYFFAVVDCDSPETADALYDHLNGMEFESSGCVLDLRFIPNDMIFEQEPVSVASSISVPADYQPTFFVTSALNQIKVDLTWDETDPRRKEVLEKAFTDPESIEKDLKEYLASPSESEDEMDEFDNTDNEKLSSKEAIAKYRQLLQSLEEKEKGKQGEEEIDMEITWEPELKDKTEKLVKEKVLKESLTPFEEKLQKRKELKKLKKDRKKVSGKEEDDESFLEEFELEDSDNEEQATRVTSKGPKKNKYKSRENTELDEKKIAELALLMAEPNENDSSDFDELNNREGKKKKMKKNKNKGKDKKDTFGGYIDDPRFSALYTSHLFHVDPAEPKFQERKETQAYIQATQRKKYGGSSPVVSSSEISKKGSSFAEGLEENIQKHIKVKNLKEKLTPFCKEFQKKTESRKSGKQRVGSLKKEGHSVVAHSLADASFDVNSPRKRKKQKMLEKQGLSVVSHGDQISSMNASPSNVSSTSAYHEDGEDSDIVIFSSGCTKKQKSAVSLETTRNVKSVRKKIKKHHVL